MAFVPTALAAIPAWVSTAATVTSAAVGAAGAVTGARAQAAAAEYNANVGERDALIADQNRVAALQQSRIAQEDRNRETRRTLASIRASYGASGVGMEGSPLDVLADSAFESALDSRRIDYEGRARNREGGMAVQGALEGARMSRMEGSSARAAGGLSAAGQLSGGVGRSLQRTA